MGTKDGRTDVVVVGGGTAGLTAASYLARGGLAVTLFEKAPHPGGRAATREHEGFLFNRGGHALYTGGAASKTFEELGVSYGHGVPKDTFVLHEGKISPFPADPLGLLRTDFLGAADKLALFRLFATIGASRPKKLSRTSVREWMDARVRRPALRRVMTALARTFSYTTALDLVSAEMFVEKFQRSLRHPIHYVDGGWRVLVDGLRNAAETAGARIVTDARVEGVEVSDGRVRGVRLRDGALLRAPAVVVATGPRDAARLVGGDGHTAMRQVVDDLLPVPIACLDVALERLPMPDRPVVQDLDRPLFASAQPVYSRVAPEGKALVISFKQLDPRHPGDPEEDERDLEGLLDAAQPGWRDLLVRRQFLPRIEAVGALPLAANGSFAGRPDVEVPGTGGLYLAGDWVGPEGFLVDASVASARRAAELAAEVAPAPRIRGIESHVGKIRPVSPTDPRVGSGLRSERDDGGAA